MFLNKLKYKSVLQASYTTDMICVSTSFCITKDCWISKKQYYQEEKHRSITTDAETSTNNPRKN